MDRNYWKEMLPAIKAFVDGNKLVDPDGDSIDDPKFDSGPEYYRIAKPKERVPLEAEDWIKDGPWWIRSEVTGDQYMVIGTVVDEFAWIDSHGNYGRRKMSESTHFTRRNAASDWMPCWKEKE